MFFSEESDMDEDGDFEDMFTETFPPFSQQLQQFATEMDKFANGINQFAQNINDVISGVSSSLSDQGKEKPKTKNPQSAGIREVFEDNLRNFGNKVMSSLNTLTAQFPAHFPASNGNDQVPPQSRSGNRAGSNHQGRRQQPGKKPKASGRSEDSPSCIYTPD